MKNGSGRDVKTHKNRYGGGRVKNIQKTQYTYAEWRVYIEQALHSISHIQRPWAVTAVQGFKLSTIADISLNTAVEFALAYLNRRAL